LKKIKYLFAFFALFAVGMHTPDCPESPELGLAFRV